MVVKLKLLLVLLINSFMLQGQPINTNDFPDINFDDVIDIRGVIYYKVNSSLVTGKVIRYNRKKEAKRYILVRNGKPDNLGWVNVNEKKYEQPEASGLGTLITAAAVTTGLVMELSGNNVDVPFPNSNRIKSDNSGLMETEITPLINYNKKIARKANEEMLQRTEISNNIQSSIYSAQTSENIDGFYYKYYEDGQLEIKGNYFDEKKNGIWEIYYSNGKQKIIGVYKSNLKDGLWKEFYENGQIKSKIFYKNGNKDGQWFQYYTNSQLWSTGYYKDDKMIGKWLYYDDKGNLIFSENYKD